MPSRALVDLHPLVRPQARVFLLNVEAERVHGVDALITCTYRPNEEQSALYAQGRTKPGRIVTWARSGESFHNHYLAGKPAALAFDVVAIRYGRAIWSTGGNGLDEDPSDDWRDDLELWQRIGRCGEQAGLVWAGRWPKGKREFPHFEHANAATIRARKE